MRLLTPSFYEKKEEFKRMHPKFETLTSEDICNRIKKALKEESLKPKGVSEQI